MENKDIYILGIESSCDDTSAAVLKNGVILSNVTASQDVHKAYGGVVPASGCICTLYQSVNDRMKMIYIPPAMKIFLLPISGR